MKLDQIVLGLIVLVALAYLVFVIVGIALTAPWGLLLLIPLGIVLGILFVVIRQRMTNREDDYYEKNVDK
ncbi:MAG: hypothetical protein H6873_09525 [Hyphomicrobiaceae bacterium]|nr:hypothetical protein [Hyphomicrobiaceae bacterium]